jgi:hypothetical protein
MSPNISMFEIPPDAESGCDLLHMPTVFLSVDKPGGQRLPTLTVTLQRLHDAVARDNNRRTEPRNFSRMQRTRIDHDVRDATSDKPAPAGTGYRVAKDMPETKG